MDRYYLRHETGTRWWRYPWTVWTGDAYPRGQLLGVAMTIRGAQRIVRRERKRRAKPKSRVETVQVP